MQLDDLTLEVGMVFASKTAKEVFQLQQISELTVEAQNVTGGYDETKIYKQRERPAITHKRLFYALGSEVVAAEDAEEAKKREAVMFIRRDTREENPPHFYVLKKDLKKWLADKGLSVVLDGNGDPVFNVQAVGVAPIAKRAKVLA